MTSDRLPAVLWPLLFGNLVIGTGVMVVPGTLNEISGSLQISTATAGQLISAAALVMCIGAPLLAAVVAGWDRRRLLAACMVWYGALHLLSASMPSFATLLPVRMLSVISPAIFTPQAAACVGLLVPASQHGRAITFVFLGWSVASVLPNRSSLIESVPLTSTDATGLDRVIFRTFQTSERVLGSNEEAPR